MTRRVGPATGPCLLALALLASLAPLATACGGDRERRDLAHPGSPSVLLVTLDTTRADHLGAYGATNGATPHLDALAARGVVFERAYAVAPMTLPAHTSMLTGLLPTRTGVRWNGEQRLAPPPGGPATVAERFRAGGYATAAFVSASVLNRAFGIDRGFELYDDALADRAGAPENQWQAERPGRETVERALVWLAAQPADRPVFLWVHLFDPHDPYAPPEPFATRFAGDPYSGEIAAADEALGALLAHARWRPEARAIVSVIGDHGEALGEHGEATHGILLQEAALRVPWIVAAPDLAPRRVAEAVGQVDLAPTLLALAGLTPFADATDGALDGVDLSRQMAGAAGDRARTLYAESLYASALYGWAPLYSTRREPYKWVAGMRGELFDYVADPGETQDLRAAVPAAAGALNRALVEFRDRETTTGGSAATVDAALAAELRSLGYLAGGAPAPPSSATQDPRDRIAVHERLRALDAQWRSGDLRGAEQALDDLFAADPQNLLLRQVVEQQLRAAIDGLAANDGATAAALRVRLAQLVALGGRREEATALLEAAAAPPATAATQALAHLSLATLALGDRRFAEAESRARAALALEPANAAAQNTLAIALDDLGRLAEAEAAYRAALALDPTLFRSEFNLAVLLAGRPGGNAEAIEHLHRFLARAPADDPRAAEARSALARLSAGGAGGG